ncbi:MAG: AsmA-like C-terminal region-containing protein, partial [Ahrensia sp.]
FGDEVMRDLTAEILIGRAGVEMAIIEASTDSGLPVSLSLRGTGLARTISIEALDAGDLLRFVDLYGQVRGGIMSVNLKASGASSTAGAVQLTDFRVFNEPRLASLVNTRSSDAVSLRDAVNRDIDTSEVRFDLAYADVAFGDRTMDLQRGVLRGPLVGLTMQGRAYDAENRMRITGTFLPAYGLNSLFADIPIVGVLLGNGRDRGLIGVTFLLTGKADKPDITVNPLSAIAPGIFRSIFEFR